MEVCKLCVANPSTANQDFAHPPALYRPEYLSTCLSALEHAVKRLPVHKHYIDRPRMAEAFPPDRPGRRPFAAACMSNDPGAESVQHYSTLPVDWQWKSSSKTLNQLVPLYCLMTDHSPLERMTWSDGKLEVDVKQQLEVLLRSFHLSKFKELFRACGVIWEKCAYRLGGCGECRRDILLSKLASANGKTR